MLRDEKVIAQLNDTKFVEEVRVVPCTHILDCGAGAVRRDVPLDSRQGGVRREERGVLHPAGSGGRASAERQDDSRQVGGGAKTDCECERGW